MADQTTVSDMSYSVLSSRGGPSPAFLRFMGLTQKPRGLWPNAHPLDHVGDRISIEMCVYISQNVPKPQRNRNLKNQKFDPSRIRTLVSGVIDLDVRHLNCQAIRALNMNAISEIIKLNGPFDFSHREETVTFKQLQHIFTLT